MAREREKTRETSLDRAKSARSFVYEGLVYYLLASGLINILCSQVNVNLFSVSMVTLTEK